MSDPKRIYRSNDNKVLLGVCGGIGEYFNLDPVLIRLIAILITLFSFGMGIIGYIAAAIVMPNKP
jgi:phage shock protein C